MVALSVLLQDVRMAIAIAGLISGTWSTFSDAMPTGVRRIVTIVGVTSGILFIAAVQLGLFFKLIHITDVIYPMGGITLTCSSFATSSMTHIIVFWARNVVTAIFYPNSLTLITSLVKSEKVSKIEARVWHASFHLKEATRYLQEQAKQKKEISSGQS